MKGVLRYGFHGLSYEYILEKPKKRRRAQKPLPGA